MRILIIEDNRIIAEDIKSGLLQQGYEVAGIAKDYQTAIESLLEVKPDFALVDIMLGSEPNGIKVAKLIHEKFRIPFIYLTSHGDVKTVEKAIETSPNGYLIKPFERKELFASIEVALMNFNNLDRELAVQEQSSTQEFKKNIFVKDKESYIKVMLDDIHYIKSEGNYLDVYLKGKKYILRSSMKNILASLPKGVFFRTNRSYAVNLKHVVKVGNNYVQVGENEIPLSREQKSELTEKIQFLS